MNRRRVVQLVVALVVSAVLSVAVLRRLAWDDFRRLAQGMDLRLLVLAFAAYLAANVVRVARIRALLGGPIGMVALLRILFVQNFLNMFLPFKAGEVSYLYMIHRSGAATPGDNLGSLVAARLFDLLAALAVPLATIPFSRGWQQEGQPGAWFAALVVSLALGLVIGISQARSVGAWLSHRIGPNGTRTDRVLGILSDTLRSLGQLREKHLFGKIAALSLACWVLIYVSGYLLLIGAHVGTSFWDSLFAYSFPTLVSMTPIYMMGGFGPYEGSVGVGLGLVGVPASLALASGLLLHLAELLFVIVPGAVALVLSRWQREDG